MSCADGSLICAAVLALKCNGFRAVAASFSPPLKDPPFERRSREDNEIKSALSSLHRDSRHHRFWVPEAEFQLSIWIPDNPDVE